VRTLSSVMRTREDFPISHPSQNCSRLSTLDLEILLRRTSKKKMHLVGTSTLLILLSLGSGYHITCSKVVFFLLYVHQSMSSKRAYGITHTYYGPNLLTLHVLAPAHVMYSCQDSIRPRFGLKPAV
jgi:hypothetical protein